MLRLAPKMDAELASSSRLDASRRLAASAARAATSSPDRRGCCVLCLNCDCGDAKLSREVSVDVCVLCDGRKVCKGRY